MAARLSLRFDANAEALSEAQRKVRAFGEGEDWPEDLLFQVELVVEELGSNVVQYGAEDGRRLLIAIEVASETQHITIDFIDDGRPFNPLCEAAPDVEADVESRPVGGLGIHLVRTMMDEFSYRREDDRNHLTLVKRRPS